MAPTSHSVDSTGSAPGMFSFLNFDTRSNSVEEEEEARNDLEGLVQFLTELRQRGARLSAVTYVINKWSLGGIIPMTHHGFIFKTSRGDFFTLDFGRKGIVWDVMDECPEVPDNTVHEKTYEIDFDTRGIQKYCEDTPPFNFPFYDCETWAKGMLALLAVDRIPEKRLGKDACAPAGLSQGYPQKTASPNKASPARKQRNGTCI